jgi:sugar phosphate permease
MRKVAARLIPVLLVLYVIAYLDRVNVTFAQDKLQDDLGFSSAVYGFGAGIFFIGYFSGGIMSVFDGVAGLKDWQWLFLIEALPAILAGFFVLWYLDDGPEHADWLEDDEKRRLARRLEGEERARLAAERHARSGRR